MNFLLLESNGKRLLEQFPIAKRTAKRVYQLLMYALNSEKIKFEGEMIMISPDDKYEYFFGYYDKSPWDANDEQVLCLRVRQAHKSVAPKEEAELLLLDTKNKNKPLKITNTHAWNVQQGCMAQWLGPDFKSKIIYNDFQNGQYCSVIYNIETQKKENIYQCAIYDVAKDGSYALSLDFSRLHRMRPGYGYSNLKDETKGKLCPDKVSIWKLDLKTGKITELLQYTDFVTFEPKKTMEGAEHKLNHLMISPNGNRFMVLHRWFQKGRKYTRLVTIDKDGSNMFNLSDDIFVSHCYWKNDSEILSFLRKTDLGEHYYLMNDKTKNYRLLWPELNTDGHCSYSPDGKYIITDTYPNRKRLASLYLCSERGGLHGTARRIARVSAPFRYDNDCRCDLHPRWNHSGDKVCIDSVHDGKRGLYIVNINPEVQIKNEEPQNKSTVTVVLATYNGELYLKEQLQSLTNQKIIKTNIIVRDDGSKDSTQKILNDWQKSKKLSWYTGQHMNVQKGYYDLLRTAAKSHDPYYAFCDQDDLWDDDKLSIAVAALEKMNANKPALYYCGQRLVDKNLKFISNHILNENRSLPTRYIISDIAGCTAVFNRCLLEKVLEFEPKFMLMHDSWILKVCLSIGGNVIVDEQAHISYRQHGSNVAGINNGIVGRIKQIQKYIYKFEIQRQTMELKKGYYEQMVPEYKKLTDAICNYKTNSDSRNLLLDKNYINFNNKGLNMIFNFKIMVRHL